MSSQALETAGRTVVVVPTYDEADNIGALLDAVLTHLPHADVLVVDDTSPDGTADVVRAHPQFSDGTGSGRVHLLLRDVRRGLGGAYRWGFTWALDHGYDTVVQMDADLSHPPDRLPALVGALAAADVAVGSRYVHGGAVSDWSPLRRLVSWAGNTYVRLVLDLPVRDSTAGYKAFRADALRAIAATASASNGYCFQIENTWRAVRLGLRVVEVPITFTDRTAGRSKMSGRIVAEALWRVLTWRSRELRGVPEPRGGVRVGPGLP